MGIAAKASVGQDFPSDSRCYIVSAAGGGCVQIDMRPDIGRGARTSAYSDDNRQEWRVQYQGASADKIAFLSCANTQYLCNSGEKDDTCIRSRNTPQWWIPTEGHTKDAFFLQCEEFSDVWLFNSDGAKDESRVEGSPFQTESKHAFSWYIKPSNSRQPLGFTANGWPRKDPQKEMDLEEREKNITAREASCKKLADDVDAKKKELDDRENKGLQNEQKLTEREQGLAAREASQKELADEMAAKKKELSDRDTRSLQHDQTLAEREQALNAREASIKELTDQVAAKKKQLDDRDNDSLQKEQKLSEREQALAAREALHNKLEDQVAAKEKELADKEKASNDAGLQTEKDLSEREQTLAAREASNDKLAEQLAAKEKELAAKEAESAEKEKPEDEQAGDDDGIKEEQPEDEQAGDDDGIEEEQPEDEQTGNDDGTDNDTTEEEKRADKEAELEKRERDLAAKEAAAATQSSQIAKEKELAEQEQARNNDDEKALADREAALEKRERDVEAKEAAAATQSAHSAADVEQRKADTANLNAHKEALATQKKAAATAAQALAKVQAENTQLKDQLQQAKSASSNERSGPPKLKHGGLASSHGSSTIPAGRSVPSRPNTTATEGKGPTAHGFKSTNLTNTTAGNAPGTNGKSGHARTASQAVSTNGTPVSGQTQGGKGGHARTASQAGTPADGEIPGSKGGHARTTIVMSANATPTNRTPVKGTPTKAMPVNGTPTTRTPAQGEAQGSNKQATLKKDMETATQKQQNKYAARSSNKGAASAKSTTVPKPLEARADQDDSDMVVFNCGHVLYAPPRKLEKKVVGYLYG